MENPKYDIFTSPTNPLDALLHSPETILPQSSLIQNQITSGVNVGDIISGSEEGALIGYGKKSFVDSAAGMYRGLDSDGVYKFIIGNSVSSLDWAVTAAGTLTIKGIGLVSPTLSYGKTSFADAINAGFWISSDGIYVGAAADASKLKYTSATGTFDFIGTVSGRSTVTVAATIDSSGNVITDLINARLDTSAKSILSGFDFGSADYAGAVKSGDIAWNTATGAVTGGSGVVVYRTGIVGAAAGVTTFSIDAATGSAYFKGDIAATSGYFGNSTNGITVDSTGLTLAGTGYVRTASSGERVEIVKDLTNGSLRAYDSADFDYLNVTPAKGLSLRSDGTITRKVLTVDVATGGGGITSDGFLNFPTYRHRSEFQDEPDGAWASTFMAQVYWTAAGTSGTAEILNTTSWPSAHISTTSTASRSITLTFARMFDLSQPCGLEGYFQTNSATNTRWFFGWRKDATHYLGFIFDTDYSSTNIYFGWADGGGDNIIDTGVDISTSVPKRYTIMRKGGTVSASTLHVAINNAPVTFMADNPPAPTTEYYPYISLENKASAEEKTIDIAYFDIFGARDV
jgi:hypothetical protein